MVMIIAVLVVLGLCLGSFVNALVFRLHMQSKHSQKSIKSKVHKVGSKKVDLSIATGRSVCVNCGHALTWYDLIPVFSWLALRGKCRYCRKPISWQYPTVELATAALFVASYAFWPEQGASGMQSSVNFIVWLIMLTGFVALFVYDLRWMLLPNRIIYPLSILAAAAAAYNIVAASDSGQALVDLSLSVLIAGGLFWGLFTLSRGKWIGGGDVKLGFLLGLVLADPYKAFLMLMAASTLGTLAVLPALAAGKIKATSRIPFGPFLLAAAVFTALFGQSLIDWYKGMLGL